ncbi:MAG: hypothetical protein L3J57_01605 [Desulfuromusa sp.]|nr:hypothetical protein [Desulfuromusa sp.]
MQREDIEVSPGQYWIETLPIVQNGQPVADLSGYEFQLQFRTLVGVLIGTGSAIADGSNIRLTATPATIALLGTGAASLYAVLIRPVDQSWRAILRQGAVKKTGVDFSWQ